jgi:5-methylthioadenosine/S-adenosylhomocysteine deaminase
MDSDRRILKDGAIIVEGDSIISVGKTDQIESQGPFDRIIDGRGKLVMPGLIDAHAHLSNEGPKGFIPDDIPALPWITDWVRPITQVLTPEDEYVLSLNAIVEMIRTGTTTFFEGGTLKYPQSAAIAMEETGMRGVIGRRTLDAQGIGESTESALKETANVVEKVHGMANGRIQVWVTLVGMGTVSDTLFKESKAYADSKGIGISIHQSLSPIEVKSYSEKVKKRPIEHFEDIGILAENLRLTHMIDVSLSEVELLRNYDVKVIHCPTTALKCGYGATAIGKFPEMIEKGICLALGCDGPNCSNHYDMGIAMYLAAGLYKDSRMDVSLVPAEKALEMGTVESAKSMLMENQIGSLEKGKKADIVLIDLARPEWSPLINPVYSLIYSLGTKGVDTVMIDGELILDRGHFQRIDEFEVYNRVQKISEDIIRRVHIPRVQRWKIE